MLSSSGINAKPNVSLRRRVPHLWLPHHAANPAMHKTLQIAMKIPTNTNAGQYSAGFDKMSDKSSIQRHLARSATQIRTQPLRTQEQPNWPTLDLLDLFRTTDTAVEFCHGEVPASLHRPRHRALDNNCDYEKPHAKRCKVAGCAYMPAGITLRLRRARLMVNDRQPRRIPALPAPLCDWWNGSFRPSNNP